MQILSSRARACHASGHTSDWVLNAGYSLRAQLQATPAASVGSTLSLSSWLNEDLKASTVWWLNDSATPLIAAGPVGEKFTIVVVGDGFAGSDQELFDATVGDFLAPPSGLFGHDFYATNAARFNLIRIDLTSLHSGVGVKVYQKTPDGKLVKKAFGKGFVVTSATINDTALGFFVNNEWALCWQEGSSDSEERLQQALRLWVQDYDILYVMLNSPSFAACGGGGRFVTSLGGGMNWSTVAHELGHAIGGLGDEYGAGAPNAYPFGEPGAVNLTTNTNRATLKWRQYLAATTPIPTGTADWTAAAKPPGWDDNHDVGLFAGGSDYDPVQGFEVNYGSGLYRPCVRCRMVDNVSEYCPICTAAMEKATASTAPPAPTGPSGLTLTNEQENEPMPGYLRIVMHHDADGQLSVVSSSTVNSPLRRQHAPTTGLASEVLLGQRRIALQPLPDVNVARSGKGPGDPQHHSTALRAFDYVLRVPAENLDEDALPQLSINVLRLTPDVDAERSGDDGNPVRPLVDERVVATLRLSDTGVPEQIRAALVKQIRLARS